MVDTAPAAIWSEGMVRLLRNQLLFFLLRFKMMIIIKLPSSSMIVVLPYERELHNKQIETANSELGFWSEMLSKENISNVFQRRPNITILWIKLKTSGMSRSVFPSSLILWWTNQLNRICQNCCQVDWYDAGCWIYTNGVMDSCWIWRWWYNIC